MNVLVLNEQQNQLQNIEVDIIKSITGSFQASEIVGMFKDFFFNKMVLDVTALKDYELPATYKEIAEGLNPDKVIFYLPEGSDLCTSGFLSRLINFGIYNFTTNEDGVKYLINNTNTFKDVEHIKKMADVEQQPAQQPMIQQQTMEQPMYNNTSTSMVQQQNFIVNNQQAMPQQTPSVMQSNNNALIIGIQNVTTNAGATSLIYMMKKELDSMYGQGVVALEIDKNDFASFNDKTMTSTTQNDVQNAVRNLSQNKIILIDLNGHEIEGLCTEVIHLIEPSVIKLNTLMRRNKLIIASLKGKKVILNKSLLTPKEVGEFEIESGLSIMYNMPPLNDRKRNEVIADFIRKIHLSANGANDTSQSGIFGLFRK